MTDGFHHIGNSTHLIVLGGIRVLTDPWVREPADHVLGHRVAPAALPTNPDIVLITHEHGDHFDVDALAQVEPSAVIVCPAALASRVRGGHEVRGVAPGERLEVGPLAIDVVRGKHSVPEVCFRIACGSRAVFFGGDTMRTRELDAFARDRPTPFVVLPGEHSALLGRRFVMTPREAIALAELFNAQVAVLTHHETRVLRRWPFGWMVRIAAPDRAEFPPWFRIPVPGERIAFPWEPS